ncbi:hypothetical protein ACLGI4_08800 [Streptomyces sp. HMX112]|uniref:hypothetical protein n=1 Tax=Streptomyces sp. HMX112 TaxID=3390850 RepID=UPI003A7F8374
MDDDEQIVSFFPAAAGWRVAIGDRQRQDIQVVPLIGWAMVQSDAPRSIEGPLEPVILWDNVGEPVVTTAGRTISDWSEKERPDLAYVHQILAPGVQVRKAPEGWLVTEYAV